MRRTLTWIIALAALCGQAKASELVSPWVRSIDMPAHSRQGVENRLNRYSKRGGNEAAMRRLAHLKPAIDDICRQEGVNPEPIYGLIMAESQARPDAIDGVFLAGKSKKAHVGLGQLNSVRLPPSQRYNPKRIYFARKYRVTRDKRFLDEWKKRDLRFNPRWNLRVTVREFRGHIAQTGGSSLAFMGHHGGGGDPVSAVRLYARDRGVKLGRKWVPAYTQKHGVNYFVLYESRGSARRYWAAKSDSHLTYGFAPVVWSELFARWEKKHGQPPIVTVAKVDHRAVKKPEEGEQKDMQGIMGWVASLFTKAGAMGTLHHGAVGAVEMGKCLGHIALMAFLVFALAVGTRHIVPPVAIALWMAAKWLILKAIPGFFRWTWRIIVITLGSKKGRPVVVKKMERGALS